MSENQQEKNLQQYRTQIDEIDDEIISLLQKRMQIVAQVADFKNACKEKFFIKSAREADMVKSLIKKAGADFPPSAIFGIWRKIITSANVREQKISVVIHNPKDLPDYKYLIKDYYYQDIPISEFDSANKVVLEVEKDCTKIAAFAAPHDMEEHEDNWWINLANNKIGLNIFAKIPFVKAKDNGMELFLAARKEPEKSEADVTLISLELDVKFSKSDLNLALKKLGLNAKILKMTKLPKLDSVAFYLIEAQGFYLQEDEIMKKFKNSEIHPFARVIGHFAAQI